MANEISCFKEAIAIALKSQPISMHFFLNESLNEIWKNFVESNF